MYVLILCHCICQDQSFTYSMVKCFEIFYPLFCLLVETTTPRFEHGPFSIVIAHTQLFSSRGVATVWKKITNSLTLPTSIYDTMGAVSRDNLFLQTTDNISLPCINFGLPINGQLWEFWTLWLSSWVLSACLCLLYTFYSHHHATKNDLNSNLRRCNPFHYADKVRLYPDSASFVKEKECHVIIISVTKQAAEAA